MKTRLLHAALFTPLGVRGDVVRRWGLPLLLWGAPGIAKTETIQAVGRAIGLHVETLSPGERGEGAFGVTPVPSQNGDGTYLEYPPPEWVRALLVDGEEAGIVFVDETNTAPPAIQPALLGLIQERRIGGHQCGPRVRVLGAANPVGHAAGGWDLPAPVANRLGHIEWPSPDADEWSAWLVGGGTSIEDRKIDAAAEEARVLKAWPEAYAKAAGLASAFVRRRPELLHKMPDDGDTAQSRAWPSPRSWFHATCALAGAEVHGLTDVEGDELVGSFIGAGPAGEWGVWADDQDLPEPSELLDGKTDWKPDRRRLDRTEAVLSACAALVTPAAAKKRGERAKRLWGLLSEVADDAKDVCVPSMRALVQAGLQRSKEARPVLAKLHGVAVAAGMIQGGAR